MSLELASSNGGRKVLVDAGRSEGREKREGQRGEVRGRRGRRESGNEENDTHRSPTFSAIPQEDW